MSSQKIAVVLALLGCSAVACSDTTARDTDKDPATVGETAGDASSGDGDADDVDGSAPGGDNGGATGATNGGATAGGATAGGATAGGATAGDGGTKPSAGDAPKLPTVTGTCPKFTAGVLPFTAGGAPRTAKIWIDEKAAKDKDGPVVFYWHGTGSSPDEADWGLEFGVGIKKITALGGIVVGAIATNGGGYPWLEGTEETFKLVDEIVACAEKEIGIDDRQIHSVGMSAGGLFTSRLSFARSNLFASVAVYSGGGMGTFAESKNKFPALVFFGGPSDMYVIDFAMYSAQYVKILRDAGHFTILCDHGMGHNIPMGDAPLVVPFFLAHPYGLQPSPYEAAFPAKFPAYCKKS